MNIRPAAAAIISLALAAIALPAAVTTATAAPKPPLAKASWSMVPQSKDANGDGFIDGDGGVPRTGALSAQPARQFIGAGNFRAQPNERLIDGALSWYLDPDGYPVQLNACGSRGDTYSWQVRREGVLVTTTPRTRVTTKTCRTTVVLPEGDHEFTLTVRSGTKRATSTLTGEVRNILMVAMGDSYASGEGNPRNVEAWLRGSGGFTPYWDQDSCNRSARGGPAQAALEVEKSSPRTSVTLVYVACSGATVDRGILGPQPSAGAGTSQVEQVRALIGARGIDVLTLSIGGNDVGFGSVLTTCALAADCPTAKATTAPLSAYRDVQTGLQARIGQLPASYARIAPCFGGPCTLTNGSASPGLSMSPGATVMPMPYPDITRSAEGGACTYLTIDESDFAWARDTILTPTAPNPYSYRTTRGLSLPLQTSSGTLNGAIFTTATSLGWNPVAGIWGASGDSTTGHGVCAGDSAWVFGLTGFTGFTSGSFHPNVRGQQVIGREIAKALGVQ